MRRQGTLNLLAAAKAAGASHFVAQSIWQLPGDAGAAVSELERLVLGANGVVLRCGRLYGPGTYYEDEKPKPPARSRRRGGPPNRASAVRRLEGGRSHGRLKSRPPEANAGKKTHARVVKTRAGGDALAAYWLLPPSGAEHPS
jgi:hypothetical protein